MKIELNIYNAVDRERIVQALANNGIKVWVEEKLVRNRLRNEYLVCFEYELDEPSTAKDLLPHAGQ